MKDTLLSLLNKIGFLNDDNKVSITNLSVIIFLSITAFKMLFSGLNLSTQFFTWKVEALDLSSTLPLLFSLLNYQGKRAALTPSPESKKV